MEILRAEDIRFAYAADEKTWELALKGVSVTVNNGEFVVIVGHNGSGKSTFARLVNALNVPESGKMLINGMDTADEANLLEIRKTAGIVFQNPDNQIVATVVEEDVAFGPENLGIPREEIVERVDEALKLVDMTEFRMRAPHMLSGGQKQRVAIAGALAIRPQLLVFDEATAMLDPKGRAEVLRTMKQLNEQGMTILFITHFMEEAAEADRIVVLAGGEIIKEGTPEEILTDMETLKKAELLPSFAAEMAHELRQQGIDLPEGVITTERLVDALCR